jgi:hypothetical protein
MKNTELQIYLQDTVTTLYTKYIQYKYSTTLVNKNTNKYNKLAYMDCKQLGQYRVFLI